MRVSPFPDNIFIYFYADCFPLISQKSEIFASFSQEKPFCPISATMLLSCVSDSEAKDLRILFAYTANRCKDSSTSLRMTPASSPTAQLRRRFFIPSPLGKGERGERRRWRIQRPERVAAVGEAQACFVRRSGCRAPQQETALAVDEVR